MIFETALGLTGIGLSIYDIATGRSERRDVEFRLDSLTRSLDHLEEIVGELIRSSKEQNIVSTWKDREFEIVAKLVKYLRTEAGTGTQAVLIRFYDPEGEPEYLFDDLRGFQGQIVALPTRMPSDAYEFINGLIRRNDHAYRNEGHGPRAIVLKTPVSNANISNKWVSELANLFEDAEEAAVEFTEVSWAQELKRVMK